MDRSRFIFYVTKDKPWWQRFVIFIAGLLVPEIKSQYVLRDEIYYRSDYMRDVHEHYGRERAQLNKAITKKVKENNRLKKVIVELEKQLQDNGPGNVEIVRGELEGMARRAFDIQEFYQQRPDGLRALQEMIRILKERAKFFGPSKT